MIITSPEPEKAVIVGIIHQNQDDNEVKENLDELSFLTRTAGAIPLRIFTQKIDTPNPEPLSDRGKLMK